MGGGREEKPRAYKKEEEKLSLFANDIFYIQKALKTPPKKKKKICWNE